MKTRVGKIARLPHHIREQLNQRLFNGALGPELAKWLNALPEVEAVLTEFFDASPINRQNLTEWRQGGYEDWLRHQDRELRIQRIAEEGTGLKHHEDQFDDDSFEHSARIALAEIVADLDGLHELKREERTKRLRTITIDLARLQNAHNRSRWAALAWTKWNDRFLGPDDYENDNEPETSEPPTPRSADFQSAVAPNCIRQPVTLVQTPEPPTPTPISDLPTSIKTPEIKPDQTTSTGGEVTTLDPQRDPCGNSLNVGCSMLNVGCSHENPIPFNPLSDFLRQAAHRKLLTQ